MKTLFSTSLTLFLVLDPLGNLPAYLSLIRKFPPAKRMLYSFRELFIGLIIMFLFHYLGEGLLPLLGANEVTVLIAGGTILFLIAIRLIFAQNEDTKWHDTIPFIVPIATPLIASPSVLAIIMIMAQDENSEKMVLSSTTIAWIALTIIFFFGNPIYKLMKEKGLLAAQRLMGLIVAIIAVQTFLRGIKGVL